MANRYWVGGTGTWDASSTTYWSATSGGANGASAPTSSDDVFFDASSFSGAGQIVTITSNVSTCKNINFTGVTNVPTIKGYHLLIYGNLILVNSMLISIDEVVRFTFKGTGSFTLTTNGFSGGASIYLKETNCSLTLQDSLTLTGQEGRIVITAGTFNTNNQDITIDNLVAGGTDIANTINLILGSSTITITTVWSLIYDGDTEITLDAGTSTLALTFPVGGDIDFFHIGFDATYHNVTITGTGLGNNYLTFFNDIGRILNFNNIIIAGAPVYITFFSGAIYKCNSFTANGLSGKIITFDSSTNGNEYFINANSTSISYINTIDSHALRSIPFEDAPGGVDSGGNTNWCFTEGCYLGNRYLQTTHLVGSDLSGDIQQLNAGKSDDSVPIYYELETQELEFGNRIMNKRISDKLVVFSENASDSKIQIQEDEKDFKTVNIDLGSRVSNTTLSPLDAHFITLRWSGNATKKSPVLEGFYFNKVEEKGIL